MYEDPFCIAKNRNYYTEENTRIVKWDEKSPPVYIIINDDSFDKSRRLVNQTRTDFQYILVSITHKSARQISRVAHVPINPRTHTRSNIIFSSANKIRRSLPFHLTSPPSSFPLPSDKKPPPDTHTIHLRARIFFSTTRPRILPYGDHKGTEIAEPRTQTRAHTPITGWSIAYPIFELYQLMARPIILHPDRDNDRVGGSFIQSRARALSLSLSLPRANFNYTHE